MEVGTGSQALKVTVRVTEFESSAGRPGTRSKSLSKMMNIGLGKPLNSSRWRGGRLDGAEGAFSTKQNTCLYSSEHSMKLFKLCVMHIVENERFTFEIDSENAILDCTLER